MAELLWWKLHGRLSTVRGRRGPQIAAVATARKILVIARHLLTEDKDCVFARPSLCRMKIQNLKLSARQPPNVGKRGIAQNYDIKKVR